MQGAGGLRQRREGIFGNDLASAVLWFGRLQCIVPQSGAESPRRLSGPLQQLFLREDFRSGQAEDFGLFGDAGKHLFEWLLRCRSGNGRDEKQ